MARRIIAIRSEKCREGRVLGVVGGDQQFAVRRQSHFIKPRLSAGVELLFERIGWRCIEVVHPQIAVSVARIEPTPVGGDAVRSGEVVVHGTGWDTGWVERDANEAWKAPFPGETLRVDDLDGCVGSIGEIHFRAIWVDPADVEGPQRISWNLHGGEAFCLRVVRSSRTLTHGPSLT